MPLLVVAACSSAAVRITGGASANEIAQIAVHIADQINFTDDIIS